MKTVFLGGPYRGDGAKETKVANVAVAREYAEKLVGRDIPFYSPHLNLDFMLVDCGTEKEQYAYSTNYAFLLKTDALAVLPGWEDSSGTKAEIASMEERGCPVFYLEKAGSIEEIVQWLHQ